MEVENNRKLRKNKKNGPRELSRRRSDTINIAAEGKREQLERDQLTRKYLFYLINLIKYNITQCCSYYYN